MIELQRACMAADADYSGYYRRFFSVRPSDGSIKPVEPVTQEVLQELRRQQQAWEVRQ
mgnify:CR=1 FL=1